MKQTGTSKKPVISALLVIIALILLIKILRPTAVLYGKVVDQSGQPVPNAELTCIPYAWSLSKTLTPVVVQSAPDGTFLFEEPDCAGARISARAPGYYAFTPSYGNYTFRAIPLLGIQLATRTSPGTPAILTMRKMGSREPLLERSHSGVLKERQTYLIGQTPDQAISLTYWHDPAVKRMHTNGWEVHDWGVDITVQGGGIIETTEPDWRSPESYIAPAEGYHPSIRYAFDSTMKDADLQWMLQKHFYLRFADGTHARIEADIKSKPTRPWALVKSWHNPTKSRNTEYDPTIALKSPQNPE